MKCKFNSQECIMYFWFYFVRVFWILKTLPENISRLITSPDVCFLKKKRTYDYDHNLKVNRKNFAKSIYMFEFANFKNSNKIMNEKSHDLRCPMNDRFVYSGCYEWRNMSRDKLSSRCKQHVRFKCKLRSKFFLQTISIFFFHQLGSNEIIWSVLFNQGKW